MSATATHCDPSAAVGRKGGLLSLQIVNPDSLGVSYHGGRRGASSPVTPWEGQLKALVDDNKKDLFTLDTTTSSSIQEAGFVVVGTEDTSVLQVMIKRPPSVPLVADKSPPAVCGPGTGYNRSALHRAVCEMDIETVGLLLTAADDDLPRSKVLALLKQPDEAGFRPLHTAAALCLGNPTMTAAAGELLRQLLAAGADVSSGDSNGNTALHWAARAGDKDAVSQLLNRNAVLDLKNASGETALHWGMRAGYRGMPVVAVLLESGARPSVANNKFKRPLELAAEGFMDDECSLCYARNLELKHAGKKMSKELQRALKETALERKETRAHMLIRSPQSRSLVLYHPECLEHHPKSSSDWEAPDRITSIMRRVLPSSDSAGVTETSGVFPHEVTVSQEFDRASLELLSRVHSTEYLSFVNSLSKDLEKQVKESENSAMDESDSGLECRPPVVPFTPLVQRTMIKVAESSVKLNDNSDTAFSAGSLKAARRAAGAVQHAVDW
jgi:hypothetical protein